MLGQLVSDNGSQWLVVAGSKREFLTKQWMLSLDVYLYTQESDDIEKQISGTQLLELVRKLPWLTGQLLTVEEAAILNPMEQYLEWVNGRARKEVNVSTFVCLPFQCGKFLLLLLSTLHLILRKFNSTSLFLVFAG